MTFFRELKFWIPIDFFSFLYNLDFKLGYIACVHFCRGDNRKVKSWIPRGVKKGFFFFDHKFLCFVEFIKRDDNVLIVRGLDAEDGTPVIDIKPFIPLFDTPKVDVKLPPWVLRHMKKHERGKHEHSYDEILKRVEIVKRCDS